MKNLISLVLVLPLAACQSTTDTIADKHTPLSPAAAQRLKARKPEVKDPDYKILRTFDGDPTPKPERGGGSGGGGSGGGGRESPGGGVDKPSRSEGGGKLPKDGEVVNMDGKSYEFHADLNRFEAVPTRNAKEYTGPKIEGMTRGSGASKERWSDARKRWEAI